MKIGDKVTLVKYAEKYPIEFDGDRIPTDPCTVRGIAEDGYHITDALGRLWFAEPGELELMRSDGYSI